MEDDIEDAAAEGFEDFVLAACHEACHAQQGEVVATGVAVVRMQGTGQGMHGHALHQGFGACALG